MPRRTAGEKNALSRKEQNRINQRAFRERKRRELDEMREALACMKAVDAGTQSGGHTSGVDVDHSNADQEPCHQPRDEPPNDTLCPADLNKSVSSLGVGPTNGTDSGFVRPSLCDAETSSSIVQPLHDDADGHDHVHPINHMQALLANSEDVNTYLLPHGSGSYVDPTWPTTQYCEPTQQHTDLLAHYNAIPGLGESFSQHNSLVADYANAQHLASKSAEWYAKAAEVGLLKIATLHRLTNAEIPTWMQFPPTYTAPANQAGEFPGAYLGNMTSLPCESALCSQGSNCADPNLYESWNPDPTQAWQWDSFGQPIQL
jgi:hypothetical protein